MTMKELPKTYEPKSVEKKHYDHWMKSGYFHAPDNPSGETYSIVIPPPNVTGALHMGHALNNTLQDILIRWKRMQGFATLWQPGTDHAGIATQNVVERELLKKEGKKRQEIGREELIKRIWKWRDEYGDKILKQLRCLGSSLDWDRTRFTLDEGLTKAVRECFVKLYEEKLIYRGKYIVNWCPRCLTALADDEVDHKDEKGHLWHIRYPFAEGKGFVIVATTRPETLLGDTAVAVNPKDERYTSLIGKMVVLPETGRHIPIVADDFVDASFGTGAVKVTPAHDPNDFQIGERHNLPRISVMDESGNMNDEAGEKYKGLSRFDCRKKIVEALEQQGLLEKIEDHAHAVGQCYRCHTTIEPYLSDQWFVKMKPLASAAMRATEDGKVRFHPERWTSFYMQWLENARDWCISRQIWWGHRIPVWYCENDSLEEKCEPIVSRTDPKSCPHCGCKKLRQDEDVLDTWFSSALWPFSTLGWPEQTPALKSYYPTSTLVTDRGIIYFWVARMVMMGMKLMGNVPFSDVYIHGTILDEQGRKMSKSLGNGIDPLDVVDKYGADAMRFSLVVLSTEGQDLKLSESKFEMGRNFCNKIWNASRFAMMNLNGAAPSPAFNGKESIADRWIMHRLYSTTNAVLAAMDDFKFSLAAQTLYHFAWNDFCDWYLEAAKLSLASEDESRADATRGTLRFVLQELLKLLHPFMPFITEEIWQTLRSEESLMLTEYPRHTAKLPFEEDSRAFETARELVSAIRNIRGEHNVNPKQQLKAFVVSEDDESLVAVEKCKKYVQHLAKVERLEIGAKLELPKQAATAVAGTLEVHIPYEGLIDFEAEKIRLAKEIKKATADCESVERKLGNESFTSRAPAEVIAKERARLAENKQKLETLKAALGKLG